MRSNSEQFTYDWMLKFEPARLKEAEVWFNLKMDEAVEKNRLMQFNNPDNNISDIIANMNVIGELYIAPEIGTPESDIEMYNRIMSEDIFDVMMRKYCITKFNQVTE